MDTKSLAQPRTAFVDEPFIKELSELTGISYWILNAAFTGERRGMALDTVKTIVAENLDATPASWTESFRSTRRRKVSESIVPATGRVTNSPTSTTIT